MISTRNSLLWPANARAGYIQARRALIQAEHELLEQVERVAEQRRALPPGPVVGDYRFTERVLDQDGERTHDVPVSLSGLVSAEKPFACYHMMMSPGAGEACPMCSSFVDGLEGVVPH